MGPRVDEFGPSRYHADRAVSWPGADRLLLTLGARRGEARVHGRG